MYVVTARCKNTKTCAKPLFAHNRYRPNRRELVIRRVDQALLEKRIIPLRTGPIGESEWWNQEKMLEFEAKLQTHLENAPEKRDQLYDIPTMAERMGTGRRHNLFRRPNRAKGLKTVHQAQGIDGSAIREKLQDFGDESFKSLAGASWARHEWTSANHIEVEVHDANYEAPMPTHFLHITSDKVHEDTGNANLFTPIHAPFMRAHWSQLGNLPEYTPMDICTPVDKDGKEMPEVEFARGELPVLNLHVDNVDSMPHIIAYMYQHNPTWLLQQIVGPAGCELKGFECKDLNWEQRRIEWSISKSLCMLYLRSTLFTHLEFLDYMTTNANHLGMDDDAFWWAIDVAHRILMDAVVLKDRCLTLDILEGRTTFRWDDKSATKKN